jgi:hypothetical protein
MINRLLLFVALFSTVNIAFSQFEQQAQHYPSLPIEGKGSAKKPTPYLKAPGDIIFSETFNGSIGTFTASGPDAAVWQFDTDGPDGQYSSPTNIDIITSTTASNGFMIFDADLSNPGAAADFVSRSGSLVSPVINLTTTPNAVLVFEHDYRHCCSNQFFVAVDVSDDGFNTFTTFNVSEPGFGVNLRAGTVLTEVNLSPFLASGIDLTNFQFRFNFDGSTNTTSHYYWQIDDVYLIEQYPYELSIKNLWLGDIVTDFETTETTQELAGELIVQAALKNLGTDIPANIRLKTRVLSSDLTEVFNAAGGTLSNNFTLVNDTILFNTGFDLSTLAIGTYTIETTIEHDQTDGILTNNMFERTFVMSENTLASFNQDQLLYQNSIGYVYGPRDPAGSVDMLVGSIFYLPIDKEIQGFDIALATGRTGFETTEGDEIILSIWEYKPENPQAERFTYVVGDYGYLSNSSMLTNNASSFYSFDFQNATGSAGSYTLEGGKSYLAAFSHFGGTGRYLWYWSTVTDDDYSTWTNGPFGANQARNWFTLGYDPLIKVNFTVPPAAGIQEKNNEVYNFSMFPNPSSDKAEFHYTLNNNSTVSYKIYDVAGKEIFNSKISEESEGKHSFEIKTSNFSEGIYNLVLKVNDSYTTHKLVIKK